MSCLVRLQTQLTDHEYLVRALEACGYTVEKGLLGRLAGELAFAGSEFYATSSKGRKIGFRRGEHGFEAIVTSGRKRLQAEIARVTQQYAYLQVVDQAKERGFDVAETVTQEDGTIQVIVRRWA